MRGFGCQKLLLQTCATAILIHLSPTILKGQNSPQTGASNSSRQEPRSDVRTLEESVRELRGQLQTLDAQLSELRAEEQRDHAEARELRKELNQTKAQLLALKNMETDYDYHLNARSNDSLQLISDPPTISETTQAKSTEERLERLEENQQLADARIAEQNQTKVESGSKYRIRLSGIVLLNVYDNQGPVDNQDFPQIAAPRSFFNSEQAFGGSLRQSQVGLQFLGPDLAGARTSADLKVDFAGGFPDVPNGVAMGIVRLRTGTIRMDWKDTSVIAGQDYLFFAPEAPSSLASLAVPPLSYSGNLWSWTPQVRIEHRTELSEVSNLLFQAGILDSLSGEVPLGYNRQATWGEQSGQPAYAARIAWSHRAFGQDLTIGFGGYYARQNFGFSRNVDGWVSTTDFLLPLGKYFDLSGEFYRGRALGGIGGGIGQSILTSGPLVDPATTIRGLDSVGGWVQLKFKPRANFEINSAFGQDNPFASELRRFPASPSYFGTTLSKNWTPFVNFIYSPRSDVLMSVEYRRLQTYVLDSNSNSANHITLSLGYLF